MSKRKSVKKQTIVDRVLRSSTSAQTVISEALSIIEPSNLPTFVKVGFDKFPIKGSKFQEIETRNLSDVDSLRPSIAFKDATDKQILYYTLGVLQRNSKTIENFIILEKEFNEKVENEKYESALYVLEKIKEKFGESIWLKKHELYLKYKLNLIDEFDFVVPENSPLYFLLKYLSNLYQMDTEDSNVDDVIEQTKELGNEILPNYIRYLLLGNNPKANFDVYSVLKMDNFTTLIDLYKSLEMLLLNFCIGLIPLPDFEIFARFFESINHVLFSKAKCFDDKFLDSYYEALELYSNNDFVGCVEKLSFFKVNDPAFLLLLSNALKNAGLRLVSKSKFYENCNLLADIYDKSLNFISSKNHLENKILPINNNELAFTLSSIIFMETSSLSFEERLKVEKGIFRLSRIQTPKGNYLNSHSNQNIQMKCSSVTNLFHSVENLVFNFGEAENKTYVKYFCRGLILKRRYLEAVKLYSKHLNTRDCAMKKDIVTAYLRAGKLEDAVGYFIKSSFDHPSANRYWYDHELLEELYLAVPKAKSIEIAVAIYLLNFTKDNSKAIKASAIAIRSFTRAMNKLSPSQIDYNYANEVDLFFLEKVCDREALKKSMLFRFQKEAYEERIKLCNLLTLNSRGNKSAYLQEAKELSKKQVLDNASKEISSSKVYVDVDYVKTSVWSEFDDVYNSYVEGTESLQEISEYLTEAQKNLDSVQSKEIDSPFINVLQRKLKYLLSLGSDDSSKLLLNMFEIITEQYCFGIRGVNSYISTRIRHGTLYSTLSDPFIQEGFLVKDNSTNRINLINKLDPNSKVTRKLGAVIDQFKVNFDSAIFKFRDQLLQVLTNSKGNKKSLFVYTLDFEDLFKLRSQITYDKSKSECIDEIIRFLNARTIDGCHRAEEFVLNTLQLELGQELLKLEEALYSLLSESPRDSILNLQYSISSLRRQLNEKIKEVVGWFKFDQKYSEVDYDIDLAFEITQKIIGFPIFKNIDDINGVIPNKFLSPLVDVLHNISINAISHSNLDRSEIFIEVNISYDGNSIVFELINNCKYTGDLLRENARLVELSILTDSDIRDKLQNEGGTGLAKILGTLIYDFKSEGNIELKFISDSKFLFKFVLSKDSGIEIYESADRRR
tara:strand:+ start:2952 stop:6317 length:3366 start_codon:yes stop_codon:yes gene_type:complete